MTALVYVRDLMGRERVEEHPIDSLLPRTTAVTLSRIAEDDIEFVRRR